jgi:hypothetical protein
MRKEIKEFKRAIELLNPYLNYKLKVVGCCCGHGKYHKTIVLKEIANNSKREVDVYFEHFRKVVIERTRRFYKKDSEGYYYIPEVSVNCTK